MTLNRREKINNQWFFCAKPNPEAEFRLICFPYAGGAASIFRNWPDFLPDNVEVLAVRLPGKEVSICEKPFQSIDEIMENLVPVLLPLLDKPFALFGHSMGGAVAYELSKVLIGHQTIPKRLFTSACRSPINPRRKKAMHNVPRSEFQEHLKQMNGTPKLIIENDEFFRAFEPGLRADLKIIETWSYTEAAPIDIPITAFYSENDKEILPDEMLAWKTMSCLESSLHEIPGDHFFIHSHTSSLLNEINYFIERDMRLVTF